MIRLSPGILSSAYKMFEMIEKYRINKNDLIYGHPTIDGTKSIDIFDTAISCRWIIYNENIVMLTDIAKKFIRSFDYLTKQAMLHDFIKYINPSWASLIPRGRFESVPFMPIDVKACFISAGLMNTPPSDDVIYWWDNITNTLRQNVDRNKLLIGRKGEKLSLEYELIRTNATVQWKSIESNLLGYDILSQISSDNSDSLLIEVKASTDFFDSAIAHITRHEWDVACNSQNYIYHFWQLNNKTPKLAVISLQEMEKNIPNDHGNGEWEIVRVPFTLYKDKFV